MNPELSFAATASLPSDLAKAKARRNVSSDVVTVRTTSTSGMSGTGLKKCRPTNRSARFFGAHHLDERHERHGIEEMQADESVGALRGGGHRRHREARG